MSETSLPPDLARLVDQVCNRYEAALRSGHSPDVATFLAEAPLDAQTVLQHELNGLQRFYAEASAAQGTATVDGAGDTLESEQRFRNFGDYQLLEEIAHGGMGVVYKARQVSLNRIVALKMIRAGEFASAAEVQRFRQEAEAAANLDHPHIVPIYEVGDHDGQHYFSMKFIEGGSLTQRVAKWAERSARKAEQRATARLLAVVARAVHHAHQRGILHRDLKPANILLDAAAEPHVTDFGLAKRVEGDSSLTRTGAIIGTPSYMAPEQAGGEKVLTTAVDVYGLGAVMYELLTGRPPFKADNPVDTLIEVRQQDAPRLQTLNPRVDADLNTICWKCLEKGPQKRYGSAEALAQDLECYVEGVPITARPNAWWERARKWVKRRPTQAAVIAISLLAGWLLAGAALVFATLLRDERDHAKKGWDRALVNEKDARFEKQQADGLRTRTQASEARLAAELARTRPFLFSAQLMRVALLGESQPALGMQLLCDERACPAEMRDFAWGYYYRLCKRNSPLPAGSPQRPTAVAFSPDGSVLALGDKLSSSAMDGKSSEVVLVDLKRQLVSCRIRCPGGIITALAFSPDGNLLAGVGPRQLLIWDLISVPPDPTQFAFPAKTTATNTEYDLLRFSSDGESLLVDGLSEFFVWDVKTGRPRALPLREDDFPSALAVSNDGRMLAAALEIDNDRKVRVWDIATGKLLREIRLKGLTNARLLLISLAFSPDGGRLAGGTFHQGEVFLWELKTGELQSRLWDGPGDIDLLCFSRDGGRLITAGDNGTGTKVWDVANSQVMISLPDLEPANSWAVSADAKALVAGGWLSAFQLWNLDRRREAVSFQLVQDPAAFLDSKAVTISSQGIVQLRLVDKISCWDIGATPIQPVPDLPVVELKEPWEIGGTKLAALRQHTDRDKLQPSLARSTKDGNMLAVGFNDGSIELWDTSKGERTAILHSGQVHTLDFSADGKTLASGGIDRLVKLWDVASGQERAILRGHTDEVVRVQFLKGGRRLASVAGDGGLKIWEAWEGPATSDGKRSGS